MTEGNSVITNDWPILEKLIATSVVALLITTFTPAVAVSETQDEVLITPKELTIPEKISAAAEKYGANESLALNIACAESIFDPLADNRYSSADGIYQFLDGTWKHYGLKHWGSLEGRSKKNADDNIDLGVWVIATYGTSDWNESKWHGYGGGWNRKPFESGLCV